MIDALARSADWLALLKSVKWLAGELLDALADYFQHIFEQRAVS